MLVMFVVAAVLVSFRLSSAAYDTVFLQDACKCSAIDHLRCESATIGNHRQNSGFIALSRSPDFYREFYCVLTIQAPVDMRVVVHINQLNIPMPRDSCKSGMLKINDGSSVREASHVMVLCGSRVPDVGQFVSVSSSVTVSYHQSRSILRKHKAFNLTFTFFKNSPDEECESGMFSCADRKCIPSSLECDGVANCPDSSDESMSYHVCGKLTTNSDPRVGITVGVAITATLTFTFILVIIYRFKCRRRREADADETVVMATRDPRTTRISVHIELPSSLLSCDTRASPQLSCTDTTVEPAQNTSHMARSCDTLHDDTEPPPSYDSLFPP